MIKDSGNRREFESGAVRDIPEGKGRCDLLPLSTVAEIFSRTGFDIGCRCLTYLDRFMWSGDVDQLFAAVFDYCEVTFGDVPSGLLEVSIHYEEGATKYGEHNWEKGIPAHSFLDSAIRHLIKCSRDDKDERHDRAFVWNLLGLAWTIRNRPECNDLPYAAGTVNRDGE